jgi:uncharacterized membrane protein YedE/YeeE
MNLAEISGGLVIGFVFGVVMQRSRFCMVAAASNAVLIRDFRYIQAFLAAWAVSIFGVSLLETYDVVMIADSGYRSGVINWLGAIVGGVLFGFGATLAGGCAAKTIVNMAEGSLGGFIVLLSMMAFAGITTYGALEPVRMAIVPPTAIRLQSGDSGMATLVNSPAWLMGAVIAIGSVMLVARLGSVRANHRLILAGGLIGLLVVGAWLVNGWLAVDEFASGKPSAIAITGPLAKLNLYLATGSGSLLKFGMLFVLGLFVGALVSAVLSGRFTLAVVDARRLPLQIVGGALMGIGATFAGGCNIGQGLSGVSTLSITSLLAAGAMFGGAVLGTKWWELRSD